MQYIQINNYIITTPIIKILNDIKSELTNGKLSRIVEKGDNISVTCPFHSQGLEKRNSCGIFIGDDDKTKYGTFNCFTCGEKGPFYHFVAECFDANDDWAKNWLIEKYGSIVANETVKLPRIGLKKENRYLDEKILNAFQPYHPYLQERKISRETAERFKVKYDPKTNFIVFPVYDEHNKLYMLTRRSVYGKTFVIDAEKEKPVYLLNHIRNNNIREVTICESQFNALTLMQYGIPAVATFGCNITDHQFDLLNKSGISVFNLAFDGDAAGIKGIFRFMKHIRKDVFVYVYPIPRGEDVNSLSKEQFMKLKKVKIKDWIREYNKNK